MKLLFEIIKIWLMLNLCAGVWFALMAQMYQLIKQTQETKFEEEENE